MSRQEARVSQVKWLMPVTVVYSCRRVTPGMPYSFSSMSQSSFWVPNTSWQQPKAFTPGNTWYSVRTHRLMGLV